MTTALVTCRRCDGAGIAETRLPSGITSRLNCTDCGGSGRLTRAQAAQKGIRDRDDEAARYSGAV